METACSREKSQITSAASQTTREFVILATRRQQTVMADYQEAPLATRPKTLDPNEYFNLSPEYRRAEEARAALRANLKRQYQMQLNNPHRKELIVSGYRRANNVTLGEPDELAC